MVQQILSLDGDPNIQNLSQGLYAHEIALSKGYLDIHKLISQSINNTIKIHNNNDNNIDATEPTTNLEILMDSLL